MADGGKAQTGMGYAIAGYLDTTSLGYNFVHNVDAAGIDSLPPDQ